ncbi:MAG: VOC family protein [Proteobacteria bacterium]|nr:VOC family protein [Pseudomonadota bacterium]MBU4472005.1 VOC family protein [Pseudomonadota bacterium]MCG2752995.1 VOC family protein [Desulfobacteraceae bacterium]
MKIEHIAIWARDIEKLKTFYETCFGATSSTKYTNKNKGFSSYFLNFDSGARLEIMQMPSVTGKNTDSNRHTMGLAHFAVSVGSVEAVDKLTATLAQEGVPVIDGPRKTGDGYYESVVLDPEKNRIEITV